MINWILNALPSSEFRALYEDLRLRESLFCSGADYGGDILYWLYGVGESESEPLRWQRCLVLVDAEGVRLYPKTREMAVHFQVRPDDLRWFGRPEKYIVGVNEIWLHIEMDSRWYVLQLRMWQDQMQALVRALKQIATEAQVKAYRRRRPYIHFGPVEAHVATQDLHGAWTLAAQPVMLYLGPSALVSLQAGQVQRVMALEQVQAIEVMRRLDDPTGGVVRFRSTSETLAYALIDYIQFGADLAEAAKRTLEDPPVFYSKKKGDDVDWED